MDGRANEACIEFLADILQVPGSSISSVSEGQSSPEQRVVGIWAQDLRDRLEV